MQLYSNQVNKKVACGSASLWICIWIFMFFSRMFVCCICIYGLLNKDHYLYLWILAYSGYGTLFTAYRSLCAAYGYLHAVYGSLCAAYGYLHAVVCCI